MTFKVFGYGSLVNRGTLPPFLEARPATAKGFRRAWRTTSRGTNGGLCSLSVVEDPDATIDGLILTFEDGLWPVIAAREMNYDALRLNEEPDVIVFRAKAKRDRFGDWDHPIFMSYVDATLQGFLREFGEDGARRFMETTEGWHVPILEDRDRPSYPRAQILSAAEQQVIDDLLDTVDALRVRPQEQQPA